MSLLNCVKFFLDFLVDNLNFDTSVTKTRQLVVCHPNCRRNIGHAFLVLWTIQQWFCLCFCLIYYVIKKHVSPIDISFKHIKILIVWRRFAVEQKFKVVDTNDADNTAAVFRCFQKHIFTINKFVIFWRILNKGKVMYMLPCHICIAGKFLYSATKAWTIFLVSHKWMPDDILNDGHSSRANYSRVGFLITIVFDTYLLRGKLRKLVILETSHWKVGSNT